VASVLAREMAIGGSIGRGIGRTDGPLVSVAPSLEAAEAPMGFQLNAAQGPAAQAICTSGRGADLVIGSGRSTMLAVVTDAFESAGCQVLGTAASGQAALNLGDTGDMADFRTIASLMWRLDHDLLRLDSRTVVILDEAGMTDGPDFLGMASAGRALRHEDGNCRGYPAARQRRPGWCAQCPVGTSSGVGALAGRQLPPGRRRRGDGLYRGLPRRHCAGPCSLASPLRTRIVALGPRVLDVGGAASARPKRCGRAHRRLAAP
jgi:hypothetical protein